MKENVLQRAETAHQEMTRIIRGILPGYVYLDVMASACLLCHVSMCCNPIMDFHSALKTLNDEELAYIISDKTKLDVVWGQLNELVFKYGYEDFRNILLTKTREDKFGMEDLPDSIVALALRFLDVKSNESFLHYGSRSGATLAKLSCDIPGINLFGIENDENSLEISKLRSSVLENPPVVIKDKLVKAEERFKGKFNKIICSGPWGLKVRSYIEKNDDKPDALKRRKYLKGGLSADWLYSLIVLDMLDYKGTAVALFPAGCLFTTLDGETREHLLLNKKIKAIIKLPAKTFTFTAVNLAMVVFSHDNDYSNGVRMIDASELYTSQRRQNVFAEEHIDMILEAMENDSEISKLVPLSKIEENNFILSPERYLVQHEEEDGEPLEKLVSFGKSAMLKASDLDVLVTDEDTGKFYIQLSEIKNGEINADLPRIKDIDEKYQKCVLKKNDIIISRNGSPFKIAIFQPKGEEEVLPVGNLYVLKADEEKINPFYLKAFLESSKGAARLNSCLTGVAMQVISLDSLKKLRIPIPSMEEQTDIANRYLAFMDQMAILKMRMNEVEGKFKDFLNTI